MASRPTALSSARASGHVPSWSVARSCLHYYRRSGLRVRAELLERNPVVIHSSLKKNTVRLSAADHCWKCLHSCGNVTVPWSYLFPVSGLGHCTLNRICFGAAVVYAHTLYARCFVLSSLPSQLQ